LRDFFYLVAMQKFNSFKDFYPHYLAEHQHPTSVRLHFAGTLLVFLFIGGCFYWGATWEWIAVPLVGYGFAWVGHFFFEKNKPATFRHPFWSLRGDFTLFFEILFGKRKL